MSRLFHYLKRSFPVTLFVFLSASVVYSQGYKIELEVKGLSDTTVILGNYISRTPYAADTAYLNSKGKGILSDKNALPQGMYVIYLPVGKYFEIMIGEDQEFEILADTSAQVENIQVNGSLENSIFFDFQKYMMEKRYELEQLQNIITYSENKDEIKSARERISLIDDERKQKVYEIADKNPDLFVSAFLKSTLNVEPPEPPANVLTAEDTARWKYNYLRAHYFDNFDPGDPRLLRTPLYEDKIINYLDRLVPQIPDTLIKEVDFLVEKSRSDSALFRYVLLTLFNHYGKKNIMGMDAVQVHIAKEYYIDEAWWSSEEFISDLKEKIEKLEPLLIGRTAPDVELMLVPSEHFREAADDEALKKYPHAGTLIKESDIDAEYLVLFFWEATCSHCKTAVPKLYGIYKDTLEAMNVKVLAISTLFGEEGKEKWVDFVNENKLYDWLNAWNPYSAEYKKVYDIMSTPQIFILDKNKKIIAKRLAVENVAELINAYKKRDEGLAQME